MQAGLVPKPEHRRREAIRYESLFLAGTLGILALAAWMDPTPESVSWLGFEVPILCVFRRVTGIPCPGCGLTRSFAFFMHGDWMSALQANLLSPLVFLAVVAQVPYRILRLRRALAGGAASG